MRSIGPLSLVPFLISLPVAAQNASIVHLGYSAPRPVAVAPGQVVHLTLHGLTTVFPVTPIAQSLPLPTFFNGLSVTLQRTGGAPEMMPLLRLDTIPSCRPSVSPDLFPPTNTVPCAPQDTSYDLWVQIPFDILPNAPGADTLCATPGCVNPTVTDAVMTVNEVSGAGLSLRVVPVIDQIHILNSCTDNLGAIGQEGFSAYASYACVPAITHSNNSVVTGANPARPGEELIAYAYGLGAPPLPFFDIFGETPAAGVPVTNKPFTLTFPGIGSQSGTKPDYVGLVGSNPGLYQINFHVPAVPATLAPCIPPPALSQISANPFNFTMTLAGTASRDLVGFCVQP